MKKAVVFDFDGTLTKKNQNATPLWQKYKLNIGLTPLK